MDPSKVVEKAQPVELNQASLPLHEAAFMVNPLLIAHLENVLKDIMRLGDSIRTSAQQRLAAQNTEAERIVIQITEDDRLNGFFRPGQALSGNLVGTREERLAVLVKHNTVMLLLINAGLCEARWFENSLGDVVLEAMRVSDLAREQLALKGKYSTYLPAVSPSKLTECPPEKLLLSYLHLEDPRLPPAAFELF